MCGFFFLDTNMLVLAMQKSRIGSTDLKAATPGVSRSGGIKAILINYLILFRICDTDSI